MQNFQQLSLQFIKLTCSLIYKFFNRKLSFTNWIFEVTTAFHCDPIHSAGIWFCVQVSAIFNLWRDAENLASCWEERCNGIQNQFYSFQTTMSILFLTLLYTYFMPNIMRLTYFLSLMKEQATQLGCDKC